MRSDIIGLFVICLSGATFAARPRYDHYEVHKIVPLSKEQVDALVKLQATNQYNFWLDPGSVNFPVMVMVPPHKKAYFEEYLTHNKLDSVVTITNVQTLIDAEEEKTTRSGKTFDWTNYYDLEVINAWMDDLVMKNPFRVQTVNGGQSYEGIHGREWIGPAASSWIINEIINSPKESLWREFNLLYFPVVNPDGYKYSFQKDRMWKKTRKPYVPGLCSGADLNKNWDHHWMEISGSSDPCAQNYAGPAPFSESESSSFSKYLSSIAKNYDIYLSFRGLTQTLSYPWGHTSEKAPLSELWQKIGETVAEQVKATHNVAYKIGSVFDVSQPVSGTSVDWFFSKFNSTASFTLEGPFNDKQGFIIPPDQIIPIAEEQKTALEKLLIEYQKLPAKPRVLSARK